MPGGYECTLDAATQAKAREELNEIPEERQSHIDTLRQWVESQPHLTCRTDDAFLLRFLRAAKFSQLRAQEWIDNFCTVRSTEGKGAPEWFKGMDPATPAMQEMLDLGINIPLPGKDKFGRTVILIQTGGYDPKKHDFGNMMKSGFMATDVLLKIDEPMQVNGVVIVLDFTLFTAGHVLNYSRDIVQKSMKCWTGTYPTRNKSVNYYNTPTLFNPLMDLMSYFMKEKLKKRLHFHKDSLACLQQEVPRRMLPREFGGEAGPMKDLIAQWKQTIMDNRDEILSNDVCKVDESKRPVQKSAKVGDDAGMVGSFRKLAVD